MIYTEGREIMGKFRMLPQ